ncbi:glycolipid anchored surface protein GAS1 [Microthyrium microscopicum]|uniref:1,3-beta-glucanosyltransferase n=1 Tax=Microthyrium microscopicum TaxID=703497 RepID=A0A6A6UR41_9PEZI|nr:glycolipid anchored surface protein GAS1 [Microthyrium microscopicum]
MNACRDRRSKEHVFPSFLIFWFLVSRLLLANAETTPIVIKGSRFFYQNGTQFFIRGISYSNDARSAPGSTVVIDTISDELSCTRDIPYLQGLGVNMLSVRDVDVNVDHTSCMNQLAAAGIYVMFKVDGQTAQSKVRNGSVITPFDSSMIEHNQAVVDVYQKYSNTLGYYFSGERNRMDETPLYKAWLIHLKEYIKKKGYRSIPVGFYRRGTYFGQDDQAQYLNCGPHDESIDFLGVDFEMDSWAIQHCVDNITLALYDLPARYSNYSIPSFVVYGCAQNRNHTFSEVETIYGDSGSKIMSGGVVKEWMDDRSTGDNLGLVDIVKGTNISVRPSYNALHSQFLAVHPSSKLPTVDLYKPTNTAPSTCPTLHWEVESKNPSGLVVYKGGSSTTKLTTSS